MQASLRHSLFVLNVSAMTQLTPVTLQISSAVGGKEQCLWGLIVLACNQCTCQLEQVLSAWLQLQVLAARQETAKKAQATLRRAEKHLKQLLTDQT